ncbi:hydroxyethylthiazole kinase [Atopobium sp. oral taxon 416]|uniref:hydroxyethylthiazole kinase n=1 Tax=Atopobium sp. oral taxon 416 TaxID=712157 RepID=UPI001BAC0536|nr:hydroxyethylthiazole kinase [Atopobium sp. oral taxon 416]QUC04484.1 hydroxyethylthiazole kinase [Atopobium sp. oral taxon 416]
MKIDWGIADRIREKQPIVLNLSNVVTIGKVANALSAIGASLITSKDIDEAKEMVSIADAVVINTGTWIPGRICVCASRSRLC